ncbi:hypothetical protein WJX77_003537 [Trebouxia sp. C0004]
MQLYGTKAVISVGEIKRSGSGHGEGIKQLKERIAVDLNVFQMAVQDQWLVHAKVSENGGNAIKTLFIFDFNTLSWLNPDLTGSPLVYRFWHLATYHGGALLVIGVPLWSWEVRMRYHA